MKWNEMKWNEMKWNETVWQKRIRLQRRLLHPYGKTLQRDDRLHRHVGRERVPHRRHRHRKIPERETAGWVVVQRYFRFRRHLRHLTQLLRRASNDLQGQNQGLQWVLDIFTSLTWSKGLNLDYIQFLLLPQLPPKIFITSKVFKKLNYNNFTSFITVRHFFVDCGKKLGCFT